MTNDDNLAVMQYVDKHVQKKYSQEISQKIKLSIDASLNGVMLLETSFNMPHLDVSIELHAGEFVASYSNDNYGEHWYKNTTSWQVIAQDICDLLDSLITAGATQVDRIRNGTVCSTTTIVGDSESTSSVKKISILPKKTVIHHFPPVVLP